MTRTRLAILCAVFVAVGLAAPTIAAADPDDAWDPTIECTAEFPMEVTDGSGETMTIEEPPEEVVALQASDARTIEHIGAGDVMTGFPVEEATDDVDTEDRTDISEGYETDIEQVVDLEPDLVIAASVTFDDDIDALRDAGLTVYHMPFEQSLDDVADIVLTTGALVDECDGAEDSVEWMDDRIQDVIEDVADEPAPLTFYAGDDQWFTPGADTPQHDMMTVAGLEDLGAEVGISMWGEISEEDVIAEDPDAIVHPTDELLLAESLEPTSAAQNDVIVAIDGNDASQPTPHVVNAIEDLATVHDEVDLEEDADDAADDDTIPGFGVVAALVAALAVATRLR